MLFLIAIAMAAAIVFLEKGERKIPVQYSRRVIGNKIYGGQSTYIPFKINPAGVMPVILASAMLNIPMFALTLLAARWSFFKSMAESLVPGGFYLWYFRFYFDYLFFIFLYSFGI